MSATRHSTTSALRRIVTGTRLAAILAWTAACGCGPGKPSAESLARYPVHGIDVSHHQGVIDWPAVARAKIDFAFIKASEGATHRDPLFARNWAASGAAGVTRGAYHYFTFCTPGAEQARNYRDVVPVDPRALPPVVDVEFVGNCEAWSSIDAIRDQLRAFIAAVKTTYATEPIVYVTEESYRQIISGALSPQHLWIRDTRGEPSPAHWLFWQHADDGHVPGIRGKVDLSVFRGNAIELRALR